jgi:hypothetical protein
MQNNTFSIPKPADFSKSPCMPSKTLSTAVSQSYPLPVSNSLAYLPICMSAGLITSR